MLIICFMYKVNFVIIPTSSLPIMSLNLFWLFRLLNSGYIPFSVLKMFFLKIPDSVLHILCLMPQSGMKPKQMMNGSL